MPATNIDLLRISDTAANIATSLVNGKFALGTDTEKAYYKIASTLRTIARQDLVMLLDGTQAMTGTLDMNGQRIDLDADNDTSIRSSSDDTVTFEVGGIDSLTLNLSGLIFSKANDTYIDTVSAGTDTAAYNRIQCGDGTTSLRYSYLILKTLESSPQEWRFGMYGDKNFTIYDQTAGAEKIVITTTGPDTKLTIKSGNGGVPAVYFNDNGTERFYVGCDAAHAFKIRDVVNARIVFLCDSMENTLYSYDNDNLNLVCTMADSAAAISELTLKMSVASTKTVTARYGIEFENKSGSGAVTTAYSFYVGSEFMDTGDHSAETKSWIRAKVYIGGVGMVDAFIPAYYS